MKNTTRIQYEIHTTRKMQHKLVVLGAGLESLRRSPRLGAKRYY